LRAIRAIAQSEPGKAGNLAGFYALYVILPGLTGAFGVSARAKKIIAIVAGILIAGVPMATLNHWLDAFVERQGQNEIESAAKRTVSLVDYRIGLAVTALDDLAARGVGSFSN
jgi:hypothetical protein